MPVSFKPLIFPDTRILVIGTMPGMESLRQQQYYGHPQNAFWHIIADTFYNGIPFTSYNQKCTVLRQHQIGLWDSLASCQRPGSMDSNIRNAVPNNFTPYAYVPLFLFNGKAAFSYFKKFNKQLLENHAYEIMPSTSPAYASLKYEQKKEIWQKYLIQK